MENMSPDLAHAQSDDPLRVAVIGAGMRSRIGLLAQSSGLGNVVAVVDPDPGSEHQARELFSPTIDFLADHRALISAGLGIDAAIVTSPDDTHAQIARDLLAAGIAVYLEKPLAISTEDADSILFAAYRTGTPLYVGHNMRHMAFVRMMRDIIARGEIGEVKAVWCRHFVGNGGDFYFKDWHADRLRSNSLLLQKGAHDIDVIHWLAGGYTNVVSGMGDLAVYGAITDRRDNSDRRMGDWFSLDAWPPAAQRDLHPTVDVEDISMMMMHLENGVTASYEQCHFTPDYWRNYTVIGTAGRLENFGDSAGGVIRVWDKRTTYSAEGDRSYPIPGEADGHSEADALTMSEFLRFVRDGAATEISPVAARNAVATAVAATESLRNGSTPQAISPLPRDVVAYFESR